MDGLSRRKPIFRAIRRVTRIPVRANAMRRYSGRLTAPTSIKSTARLIASIFRASPTAKGPASRARGRADARDRAHAKAARYRASTRPLPGAREALPSLCHRSIVRRNRSLHAAAPVAGRRRRAFAARAPKLTHRCDASARPALALLCRRKPLRERHRSVEPGLNAS